MSWAQDREKLLSAILAALLTIGIAGAARVLVRQEQVLERLTKIEAHQAHLLYRLTIVEQVLQSHVTPPRWSPHERQQQGENGE